jgi:heme exporter protein A
MTARLAFDRVACLRGDRLLFEDLSFALEAGDAALLTGPNGAGKSSLMRIAAGLLPPPPARSSVKAASPSRERRPRSIRACRCPGTRLLGGARRRLPGRYRRGADGDGDRQPGAKCPSACSRPGQRKRAALARASLAARRSGCSTSPATASTPLRSTGWHGRNGRASRAGGIVVIATHQPLGLAGARSKFHWGRGHEPLGRDHPARLRTAWAQGGGALLPLIFFLLVATLFPFAVGPDGPLLAKVGGGALWMAALLAALLPVDRLVGTRCRQWGARSICRARPERRRHRRREDRRALAGLRPAADDRRPARRALLLRHPLPARRRSAPPRSPRWA